MRPLLKYFRTALLFGALGLIGLGLAFGPGGREAARADAKDDNKSPPRGDISPPPADVNALSMEVAALRTLHLLQAGPDQMRGVKLWGRGTAQQPRQRAEANVSANYRKVLTELRGAFIAGQEDRINELTDQLDELTKAEQPDLDDAVEITALARRNAPQLLKWFDTARVVNYLAAYGKDFPAPFQLMLQTMHLDGKGKKPTPEQWKEIRAFVIQEMSWQIGGLDLGRQEQIGGQVARLLDRAYAVSPEEMPRQKVELRKAIARITDQAGPTDIIKHVIEQDLAELLANPRLMPAVEARLEYLKKSGN
jgi:hypothetical protein